MTTIRKICIIGGGHMGSALAEGLLATSPPGAVEVTLTARTQATLDRVKANCPGLAVSLDNASAAAAAQLVILAVKPRQLADVAGEIRQAIDYRTCTIASAAAGVGFEALRSLFPPSGVGHPALMRVIPNTAVALGRSVTLVAESGVATAAGEAVRALFRRMGQVVEVGEDMMAAGTALASCGMAYALKYLEAAMAAGAESGFGHETARAIVMGTMEGALALLEARGTTPRAEIEKVATPGGYTARGLEAMEREGFTRAVARAITASM